MRGGVRVGRWGGSQMSNQETLITSLQTTCFQNVAGRNCTHGGQTFTKWTERQDGPGLSGFSQGGAVGCFCGF